MALSLVPISAPLRTPTGPESIPVPGSGVEPMSPPWPTMDPEGRPLLRPQTLGGTSLLIGTQALTDSSETLFALLVRLVHTPGHRVMPEQLRTMLWPDQPLTRQRANLRQALYKLRQMGVRIALTGDRLTLDPAQLCATFALDRTRAAFERDVVNGTEPFGVFLGSFQPASAELAEWVSEERDRVHAEVRRVLMEMLRDRRERVDWTGATRVARWLLAFDGLNEEATLTLAESLAVHGAKKEAVALLDRYLQEVGSTAVELRWQASILRRRIVEPAPRSRTAPHAASERHFVGREAEVAALLLAVREAKWRRGSATLLHAGPGMGKSRLVQEVSAQAIGEGVRVAKASCRESDLERPLSIFLDLVPELMQWPGALGCDPDSLAALQRLLPASAVPRGEGASDGAPRGQLRPALLELLTALADERPILLVVEDCHWIDAASWEVLADLMEQIPDHALCLLLTSRLPHARPHRPQREPLRLQHRALPPLSPEACETLVTAMSDEIASAVSPELAYWFSTASEGNPLFLRSLVRHWQETGEAGGVPPTLQGVIEQRLLALPAEALRVLKTAVLLQRWATPNRIMHTLELRPNELLNSLDHLERTGILVSSNSAVVQVHDLVACGVQDRMSPLERSTLYLCTAALLLREAQAAHEPEDELIADALTHLAQSSDTGRLAEATVQFSRQIANFREPLAALRLVERAQARATAEEKEGLNWVMARLKNALGYHEFASRMALPLRWNPSDSATHTQDNAETTIESIFSSSFSDKNGNPDNYLKILISIAKSEKIGMSTRRRAAMHAAIVASWDCNLQALDSAYNATNIDLSNLSSDTDTETIALIYHTENGNHAKAREISERLLARAKERMPSSESFIAAMRAGTALQYFGSSEQRFSAYLLAYEAASAIGATQNMISSSFRLAFVYLHDERLEEFDHWVSRASSAYSQLTPDQYDGKSAMLFVLLCRQAIEYRNASAAFQYWELIQQQGVMVTWMDRKVLLSYRAAIAHIEHDEKTMMTMLEPILELRERTARFGEGDFITSIAMRLLHEAGRDNEAKSLVERYALDERQDQRAFSGHLKESCRLLGIDPELYTRPANA